MASFVIDTGNHHDGMTGYGKIDYLTVLLDAANDAAPAHATQDQIDAELARLIVLDLLAPKRAETARMHFARYWPLIQGLAPASYDHVIQEYAERLAELR